MNLLQKIFSVKNCDEHKVVTILGIKLKFKSQKLFFKKQFNEIKRADNERFEYIKKQLEKFSNIEQKHSNLEQMFSNIEQKHSDLEQMFSDIEQKHSNLEQKIQDIDKNVSNLQKFENKINHINQNVVKTFQYMTGIELNKNYIQEREIVFDPIDVPKDHYNRYIFAKDLINEDDIVADIACTCGYGSKILSEKANKVIGVDINENVINFAKKVYGNEKIKFFTQDAQNLNLEYVFDKVVSFETIEHIPNPELFLKKIYSLLKPQGKIICSVPNEDKNHYETAGNKFHYRHYTEEQFKELLENNGFKVEKLYHQYWDDNCAICDYRQDKNIDLVLIIVARKNNESDINAEG